MWCCVCPILSEPFSLHVPFYWLSSLELRKCCISFQFHFVFSLESLTAFHIWTVHIYFVWIKDSTVGQIRSNSTASLLLPEAVWRLSEISRRLTTMLGVCIRSYTVLLDILLYFTANCLFFQMVSVKAFYDITWTNSIFLLVSCPIEKIWNYLMFYAEQKIILRK